VLLLTQEFVSDVQGGKHGDTQGESTVLPVRGDSTHLSVNHGCELLNIVGSEARR